MEKLGTWLLCSPGGMDFDVIFGNSKGFFLKNDQNSRRHDTRPFSRVKRGGNSTGWILTIPIQLLHRFAASLSSNRGPACTEKKTRPTYLKKQEMLMRPRKRKEGSSIHIRSLPPRPYSMGPGPSPWLPLPLSRACRGKKNYLFLYCLSAPLS